MLIFTWSPSAKGKIHPYGFPMLPVIIRQTGWEMVFASGKAIRPIRLACRLSWVRSVSPLAATFPSTMNFEFYFGAFADFIWIRIGGGGGGPKGRGNCAQPSYTFACGLKIEWVFSLSQYFSAHISSNGKALNFPFGRNHQSHSAFRHIQVESLRILRFPPDQGNLMPWLFKGITRWRSALYYFIIKSRSSWISDSSIRGSSLG